MNDKSDAVRAADALNCLSSFLAHEQIDSSSGVDSFLRSLPSPREGTPTDVIVFCASSVLSLADDVFSAISGVSGTTASGQVDKISCSGPNLAVVLCGGIGHSTPCLYEAIRKHPTYKALAPEIEAQPESRVLQMIAERWFGLEIVDINSPSSSIHQGTPSLPFITVEDQSTNCGANAFNSRKVLEAHGIPHPRSIIVVQDPTMSRRTVASFEKVYADLGDAAPQVASWPTFVPQVSVLEGGHKGPTDSSLIDELEFSALGATGLRRDYLWSLRRFVDLVVGEIPRLRDNEAGYGPEGKGFIAHVDVPESVEKAWETAVRLLGSGERV